MGSTSIFKEAKELVINQVSIGGFDNAVSAKELSKYIEKEVGLVCRCRLKTSWTPPESYPDCYFPNVSEIQRKDNYDKVVPHAFVHFLSPLAAIQAHNLASSCKLVLKGCELKANWGTESSLRFRRRRDIDPFKIPAVHAEIGTLVSSDEFWVGWKGPDSGVDFVVDPFDGTCKILFSKDTAFSLKSTNRWTLIKCNFKVEFSMMEISEIKLYKDSTYKVMLLQLTSSPCVYYRSADDDIHDSVSYTLLDDEDPWIRTTDFTSSRVIGRCNSYLISFSPRFGGILEKCMAYIRERRIAEYWLEHQLVVRDEPEFGMSRPVPFFCIQYTQGISFDVLFLLNALLHRGVINQYELSEEFFGLLREQTGEVNVVALHHIYSHKHPIFDAYKRLKIVQEWLLKNPELLKSNRVSDYNVKMRRLVITPSKAYCLPPEVELSNRVLRKYRETADRFLRVTFSDEDMQQLQCNALSYYVAPIVRDITSKSFAQKTTLFKRVMGIMHDGFYLCNRKYSFLAFSQNQLRDHSAWFFADDKTTETDAASIRKWMGEFDNKNVAKCAARMGQCFSSTYATVNVPFKQVDFKLSDIKRNGHVFSDGIGKITPDLAMEVAQKLQLTLNPPCAYQIRYAGCKGVVACWSGGDDGIRLFLRRSMNKFRSDHTTLEIVSWTRFQPCFLNRQIVTLLSALGVQDNVFLKMQDSMVYKLNQILKSTDVAFEVLTTSCSEQMSNNGAIMLSAGFKPQIEPYLRRILSCIRCSQLGKLLEKARIFVPSGRWLLGCLDELEELEHGQCFIQASMPSLENCFAKHDSRFSGMNNVKVITGLVVIAKNPCLHPGDIRILEAVDVPALHHLVDCLVFPQKGERPHTNEASGSDLDGDNYFVTWDENLIPPNKSCLPMDYTTAKVKELNRDVTTQDIVDFFAKSMVTENLGVICNAHVVHADLSDCGALDDKCRKLAELAAIAVDFPKTGKVVTLPAELKPKLYPDFMGKDEHQSYISNKVLGKLYRKVKDASNDDMLSEELTCAPEDIPYDTQLEIPGSEDFVVDAWSSKCSYDGQLNALLGQYKVSTEEEIVTGHVWSMPKYSSRKKGELEERLQRAYSGLHNEFRCYFEAIGPHFELLTDDEKNTLYEQKASAWYKVTYHPRWVKKSKDLRVPDGNDYPVRLSFAWIAADYLARIKVRHRGVKKVSICKPIDSLANYLADKI